MKDNFKGILSLVRDYYSQRVVSYGPTFKGVDWKDQASQELRFEQLLKVCDHEILRFSINDYGCGYGYLFGYMNKRGYDCEYVGLDVSMEMIVRATAIYGLQNSGSFLVGSKINQKADYTLASGVFNVKLTVDLERWEDYLFSVLNDMHEFSKKGFAFNCLSLYSDKECMREDLYYADPYRLFDYCKRHYSRNVALLHDYDLYEFTILVRK